MADQSDVEQTLATLILSRVYPSGIEEASALGADCRIYRGWPIAAALDADLANGVVNVTVNPAGTQAAITTRYIQEWTGEAPIASLTVSATGNQVTFGGVAAEGQVAGVLADRLSYAYRLQAGDTPELVAANLAALARKDWVVNLSGRRLTILGPSKVLSRVVADATVQREIRRQRQTFQIAFWCPGPGIRDSVAVLIDEMLARLPFITIGDGVQARIQYEGTSVYDQSQNALLYRRDLLYGVEYPTVIRDLNPTMLFGDLTINAADFAA
jgi:hypothetical protein